MAQPLSDSLEPVNILYYGDGGMGKTTDLMALANLGKVWACNAESGIKRRPLLDLGIKVENIEVYPGPGERLTVAGLEAEWLRIREELDKDPSSYVGTIWDSTTEIQQALKDSNVEDAVERAGKAGRERSPFVVSQDDWRMTNEQMRQLIRKFRDLPCHFGMSALQRREQDDDGRVVYQPGVTASLQADVVGWMDIVCHCSVEIVDEDEQFRGLFRPHGKFRGKDRFRATPKHLVDPWFDRVIQYVDGEMTLEDDPVMQAARELDSRLKAKKAA